MGNKKAKWILCAVGAAAAWAAAIRPRTKYGPDMAAIARYDYANGGLYDYYSRIPEHSLPAVRKAMVSGYAVKLDIRLTKDGVPIAFPDHDLWRICGTDGSVEETPWSSIRTLTLQETEEPVCTLEDMLHKIDTQVPVILNLISWRENYGTLCSCVSDTLELYDGVYAIESPDFRVLRWFRDYEPDVLRGLVYEKKTYNGKDLIHAMSCFAGNFLLTNFICSPDFISVDHNDRKSLSLRYCRLLYHVPLVYHNITSDDEYEDARADDAIAVFEKIEPQE